MAAPREREKVVRRRPLATCCRSRHVSFDSLRGAGTAPLLVLLPGRGRGDLFRGADYWLVWRTRFFPDGAHGRATGCDGGESHPRVGARRAAWAGRSWLERRFPFWLAGILDRLLLIVLPALTVMLPVVFDRRHPHAHRSTV